MCTRLIVREGNLLLKISKAPKVTYFHYLVPGTTCFCILKPLFVSLKCRFT